MAATREPFNVTGEGHGKSAPSSSSTAAAAAPAAIVHQYSGWHSPVPYLFGGLAAMMGLIAFALLILACSYLKLSGFSEGTATEQGNTGDLESGGGDTNNNGDVNDKKGGEYEEKIFVIMAGQVNPTYLATPTLSCSSSFNSSIGGASSNTSRSSSFGDHTNNTLLSGCGGSGGGQ